MLNCAVALYYFILQFYVWRHAPSLIVFVTHRAKFERCMFEVRIEVRYDGRPPMKAASLGGESGGIKLCTWCMILHNIMYNAMRTIKLSTTVHDNMRNTMCTYSSNRYISGCGSTYLVRFSRRMYRTVR